MFHATLNNIQALAQCIFSCNTICIWAQGCTWAWYIHSSFYTTVKAPAKHRHIKISESLVTMIIYSAFTPWTYCTYLPFSNEWMSLRTNNISFLLPSSAAIKWQQQKQCSGFRIRQFAITLDHISPALLTTERLLWDTFGCLFY